MQQARSPTRSFVALENDAGKVQRFPLPALKPHASPLSFSPNPSRHFPEGGMTE